LCIGIWLKDRLLVTWRKWRPQSTKGSRFRCHVIIAVVLATLAGETARRRPNCQDVTPEITAKEPERTLYFEGSFSDEELLAGGLGQRHQRR
jgi:hypothetical protein